MQRLRRRLKPVILFLHIFRSEPLAPSRGAPTAKTHLAVWREDDARWPTVALELRVNDYMHPRPRRAPHSAAARAKGIPVILAPERRFYDACVAHSSGPSSAAVFAASAYAEPRRAPALAAISCLLTDGRTRRWTRCRRHQNSPRREAPE